MNKISGLVITYNEEKNIRECVQSLFQVCDEVVVIDSLSTDGTVETAHSCGAVTFTQPFLGDGPQRNFGLQYCRNDWVLNLDADERVDTDLVRIVNELDLEDTPYEAFECRRKNFLHGELIKVAGWYPDYIRRLFNKKRTAFSEVKTHSKILTKKYLRVNCHILHYSFHNYEEMLNTLNKYSTWQSESLYNEGSKVNVLSPVLHGSFSFVKHYFIKKGFLAGLDGLTISALIAMGSYFKYAKLLELYRYRK